jgi:fucose 4-O-acetylase-like acetyltransferase
VGETVIAGRSLSADASPVTSRKLDWVDAAKGIAIILVVVGHAWRGMHARGLIAEPLFHAVDSRIYSFHMPVFFAVSGLFVAGSVARKSPRDFVVNRILRLVWPLTLWTYLFLATKLLAGDFANSPITAADLVRLPFPGYLHLWFLWALFLQHMAIVLTRPFIIDGHYATAKLAALAVLSIALALMPLSSAIAYWFGNAIKYAPFLVMGIMIGQTGLLDRFGTGARLIAAIAFLCVIVAWPLFADEAVTRLAGSCILTFGLIAVVSAFGRSIPTWASWLVSLGTASMAIYLCHTVFSAAVREALLSLGIDAIGIHLILGTVAGIVGSLAVLWLSTRTGTRRILGF